MACHALRLKNSDSVLRTGRTALAGGRRNRSLLRTSAKHPDCDADKECESDDQCRMFSHPWTPALETNNELRGRIKGLLPNSNSRWRVGEPLPPSGESPPPA